MNLSNLSYEELANALYIKGKEEGYSKVTDKTKWREPVMADKLGHTAHPKISAGAGTNGFGSDAFDPLTNKYAEYKSTAIRDGDETVVRKFLSMPSKKGKILKELTIGGIYNGAYKQSSIDAYANIDHYFGIFFEERCVLIAKIPTEEVIRQLQNQFDNQIEGKTTNLKSVGVPLSQAEIVYDNRSYLKERFGL